MKAQIARQVGAGNARGHRDEATHLVSEPAIHMAKDQVLRIAGDEQVEGSGLGRWRAGSPSLARRQAPEVQGPGSRPLEGADGSSRSTRRRRELITVEIAESETKAGERPSCASCAPVASTV